MAIPYNWVISPNVFCRWRNVTELKGITEDASGPASSKLGMGMLVRLNLNF